MCWQKTPLFPPTIHWSGWAISDTKRNYAIPTQVCKDYLITPNNDGNADVFYFLASGKVEIFDKRGNLVKRLSIPGEWDCFSEKGKVASGYYIADINDGETQIGLSVVY